ncbi:resolvase [Campylobacter hyointestinalis]|uniref:resolvase n=1 Tax=Campylobacter hyointestinalis TaxID=198 RepID=UPI000DCEE8AC|nr:resolvase [Campylobacter hyointestinalis]RAZ38042.1 resolvase [Campylobacter hyointestinalis subsp. lawsonii]RAZ54653.1 resolvase [Campylobacter hyointestinalis subsp. lawsonii]RAZ63363.1 resolvase [Campylobacter hyointestinalis subsp. lawsonii]
MAGNINNFDILKDCLDLELIRELARLNNEAFRLSLACYLCDLVGGLAPLPTKLHKVVLAKELLKDGLDSKRIIELTQISNSTLKRLKNVR